MKLVTFETRTAFGPVRRIGAVTDPELPSETRIVDLNTAYGLLLREGGDGRWKEIADAALPPEMLSFLEGGKAAMDRAREALNYAGGAKDDPEGRQLSFRRGDVKILAPVTRPRQMRDFSEYLEHMSTRTGTLDHPALWYIYAQCYKANPGSVFGPDDPIIWPDYTERLDVELELGAVIGKSCRNISVEESMDHVAGFTIFLDPSARDVQSRELLGPYKAKDWHFVLGPTLVTTDEFDEMDAKCGIRVNGETWFEGNTGHLRQFATPELVAYAADSETLWPGDIIVGGTIGFGCSVDIQKWVKPGDKCEYWIEGIGTIKTEIVREPNPNSYVRDGLPGRLEGTAESKEIAQKIKDRDIDMNDLGKYLRREMRI